MHEPQHTHHVNGGAVRDWKVLSIRPALRGATRSPSCPSSPSGGCHSGNIGVKMPYIEELRALVGHRPLILVCVPVMIFDDHQRLLLQFRADDNAWGLPGGYVERGETTQETARREVREETGLDVGELALFQVFSGKEFYYVCPNGDQVFAVWVVYVTNDARGYLRADGKEGFELRYFSTQDIPVELTRQSKLTVESFLKANRP